MIIDVLAEYLGEPILTNRPDEYRFYCPHCNDHKPRLYVSTSKHMFNCYNCGEYHGSLIRLLKDLRGCSFKEAFEIYKEYADTYTIPDKLRDEILEKLKVFDIDKYMFKQPIPLPETFTLLDESTTTESKRIRKVLHSRLITDKMITMHKFGYCYDGEYAHRAILPIYEQGELQFWVARATVKNAYKKEMSPANEPYQISKSEVIFNIDNAVTMYNSLVLCEGIYDSAAFSGIGAALLGKQMSQAQLDKILKYKDKITKGIYIALDEDAKKYAIGIADELYKYFPVKMIEIHDDPNAMGRRACINALKNAMEYNNKYKLQVKLGIK